MAVNSPTGPTTRRKRINRFRSLTRLVVGGVELGWEQFWERLAEWESMVSTPATPTPAAPAASESLPPPFTDSALTPGTEVYTSAAEIVRKNNGKDVLRLAAIGLIFQTEDNLRDRAAKGRQIIRSTQNVLSSLSEPFRGQTYTPPGPNPFKKRFNRLVRRGELELASWIRTGEEQEREGRQLAELAWRDTTEDSIDYLASNPSVQELVQTQSTGLAAEVIEEVRERTVSADTFLEGIARNILRKTPRAVLPAPPPEVKEHAASLRPQPTKSTSKQKSPQ